MFGSRPLRVAGSYFAKLEKHFRLPLPRLVNRRKKEELDKNAKGATSPSQPPTTPVEGAETTTSVVPDGTWSEQAVREWLVEHGVVEAGEAWGQRKGTKDVADLCAELRAGESALELHAGTGPVRVVQVVNVLISRAGTHDLVCTHQTIPDGTVKLRGLPLSEKKGAHETPEEAAVRGVVEELGVEAGHVKLALETLRHSVSGGKTTSAAFPGIRCRFEVFTVEAAVHGLPEGPFDTQEEGQRGGGGVTRHHWDWVPHVRFPALSGGLEGVLQALNHQQVYGEKKGQWLPGTREWLFKVMVQWLDEEEVSSNMLWLMGSGGTGKSVILAEWVRRTLSRKRVAAVHFCRHDEPDKSVPAALLGSMAAMMCHWLPGYRSALKEGEVRAAVAAGEAFELFRVLMAEPLRAMPAPEGGARVLVIDALDEIPADHQKALLDLIATKFSGLPPWVRLLVTSRDEPRIRRALKARGDPKELRADDASNLEDVRAYLRVVARRHLSGGMSVEDLEKQVEAEFPELQGKMEGRLQYLKEPIELSKRVYDDVVRAIKQQKGYKQVLQIQERRPQSLVQEEADFDTLYEDAVACRERLRALVAEAWEEWKRVGGTVLFKPVPGTQSAWVEDAVDPGVKGKDRAREKMANDYKDDARMLKDLARVTLVCDDCEGMLRALEGLRGVVDVSQVKNKFASPTPMGYRDLNLCAKVELPPVGGGKRHVCEVQINLGRMLEAKDEAHEHYEVVRKGLPEICRGTGADAGQVEAFIVQRLNTSELDAAVELLERKADGLMMYAALLDGHLAAEAAAGRAVDFGRLTDLPAGIHDLYMTNFRRCFPGGSEDPRWPVAKQLLEVASAARELVSAEMAQIVLGAENDERMRAAADAVGLVLPEREGRFHFIHKSLRDWLGGVDEKGRVLAGEFALAAGAGHVRLGDAMSAWLEAGRPQEAWGELATYLLVHGVAHLASAPGRLGEAIEVYSGDLDLMRDRVAAGMWGVIAEDLAEIRQRSAHSSAGDQPPIDVAAAAQAKAFACGRNRPLLEADPDAVYQLAAQEPDSSAVRRAVQARSERPPALPRSIVEWHNRPQAADPCTAVLPQAGKAKAVAWSGSYIAAAVGRKVLLYDAVTERVMLELEGHESDVLCVDLNVPQGCAEGESPMIVSGDEGGTVKVWDCTYGGEICSLREPFSAVRGCAWSPDGQLVASCSNKTVKVWVAASGEEKSTLRGHSGRVYGCAWSPDGRFVASCAVDGTVKIWEAVSGEEKSTLRGHSTGDPDCKCTFRDGASNCPLMGHSGYVWGCAWSPDGQLVASCSSDKTVKVWEAASGEAKSTLRGHSGDVLGCAWSPDGQLVASCSHDDTVKVWEAVSGEEKSTLRGHSGTVWGCAWSPDGGLVASCSEDGTVKICEAVSGEEKSTLRGHSREVLGCALSPDGGLVASCSDDGTVKLWEAVSGKEKSTRLRGHGGRVCGCAWSPDGGLVASCSSDKTVKIWEVASGKVKSILSGHSLHNPECTCEYELMVGAEICSLRGHSRTVRGCAWSPDGQLVASCSEDGTVKLWEAVSGEEKSTLRGHSGRVLGCAWSPDGGLVASCSEDGTVKVWEAVSGEEKSTLRGHSRTVRGCAWSPDGQLVASCSDDGTVKIWEAVSGEEKSTLRGHSGTVLGCAWCPDGGLVASCSSDKTVKVWEAVSGEEKSTLRGHQHTDESGRGASSVRSAEAVAEEAVECEGNGGSLLAVRRRSGDGENRKGGSEFRGAMYLAHSALCISVGMVAGDGRAGGAALALAVGDAGGGVHMCTMKLS